MALSDFLKDTTAMGGMDDFTLMGKSSDPREEAINVSLVSSLVDMANTNPDEIQKSLDEFNAGTPISNPQLAKMIPRVAYRYGITPGNFNGQTLSAAGQQAAKDAEPGVGNKIIEGVAKIGGAVILGAAAGQLLGAGAAGGGGTAAGTAGTAGTAGGTLGTLGGIGSTIAGINKAVEDLPGTKEGINKVVQNIPGTKEQAQGLLGAGASYYAGEEQKRAAEAAAEQAKRVEPWYEAGRTALGAQSELLGLTGTPETQLAALQASPGYQFRRQMGERQLTSGLAARGGMGSGKAATAAQKWGQDFASQEYGNRLSQLSGLSSGGYLAGANLGTDLGNLELVKSQARLSGLAGIGDIAMGATNPTKKKPGIYDVAQF